MRLFTSVLLMLTECMLGLFFFVFLRAGLQSQRVFSNLYLSFCPTFPSGKTLHHRLFETVGPPQQEECSAEQCFHSGHTEAGAQLVKRVQIYFFHTYKKKHKV